HVAAVDLGSNSFHMIVARDQGDELQILDRLKEPVRLAENMGSDRLIQEAAFERGLACLARFGERLNALSDDAVRVVGTNTLRRARNADSFLQAAEKALGYPIDIISGTEEARLIYSGVAPSIDPVFKQRLIVDIGGGSTEVIAGKLDKPKLLESLSMGCVTLSQKYFPDGVINAKNWKSALTAAKRTAAPIAKNYRKHGWDIAVGTSGTIRTLQLIAELNAWGDTRLTAKSLTRIRKALLKAGHIDKLALNGLSDDRRPVITGGLVVLTALFECLGIESMAVSDRALRDGLLYDILGRQHNHDIRSAMVTNLATRYEVDIEQALRVEQTALAFLDQVGKSWRLDPRRARQYLSWASWLHEIGLAITHNKHNRHGAYLLRHSDVAGFSQTEQRVLAALIYLQRGKFREDELTNVPPQLTEMTNRLAALLRLAVLLNRSRVENDLPETRLKARRNRLRLDISRDWLDDHPLVDADLKQEKSYLSSVGIKFSFGAPRKKLG
ncbi:MAG: exopolyphosphatase, partial [Salinisphaeraceae bacterium]|nr:exopolyphosphatase [Salinisphaeraceae bacterium]